MTALKPCPFCGDADEFNPSVSVIFKYAEPGDPDTGSVGNLAAGLVEAGKLVECDKCGAQGPSHETSEDAIAAWNTRPLDQLEGKAASVGWEEIESAPKDGTEFQAWCLSVSPQGHRQEWWEPRARINRDSEAVELWGRTDYDQDGWDSYSHIEVTHWMPLPTPPEDTDKSGDVT